MSNTVNAANKTIREFVSSFMLTGCLALLLIFYNWNEVSSVGWLITLPFFVLLYFTVFSIGKETVLKRFQEWIRSNWFRIFLFPALLLFSYVIYLLLNGQNPLLGNPYLVVYILFFPVIAYAFRRNPSAKIGWFDFTVFALTLLPGALFKAEQSSEMPLGGEGFDSFFHVMIILSGVYVFAVVRGIKEVGFVPEWKWKSMGIAIGAWLAFYALVFVLGTSVGFIQVIGYDKTFGILFKSILFSMIGTFLHTALYEELFFRGILQNMLARRISQSKSWKIFWAAGFVLLLACAFIVGYTLDGKMKWFPALVTVLLFAVAYFIEKSGKSEIGIYTSLALTSVTFGLVHYHAKSIIYIGLACVAGWAYGYTYIKTKNVFYSALVHMLVNTSVLIFGLKMMR
jgi:membrane protease YdiL (CAAX protease family)